MESPHSPASTHAARGLITVIGTLLILAIGSYSTAWAASFKIKKAEWKVDKSELKAEGEGSNGQTVTVVNRFDPSQVIGSATVRDGKWKVEQKNPDPVPCAVTATENSTSLDRDVANAPADCAPADGGGGPGPGPGPGPDVSINSTSQNGNIPPFKAPVPERPQIILGANGYQVLAVNDLGMHCGDLDTRVSSVLPPFNVLHAQVIQKGPEPKLLNGSQVSVYYSAASNPNDPILGKAIDPNLQNPPGAGNPVYKTNFWDAVDAYQPFYPPAVPSPLSGFVLPDRGLPVPDLEALYPISGAPALIANQQDMPGITDPYTANKPQRFEVFARELPFFEKFAFGYRAEVNWHEAPGAPLSAFDDSGREAAYAPYRIEAMKNGTEVATQDIVPPISGEANCQGCHLDNMDSNQPANGPSNGLGVDPLDAAGIAVTQTMQDPEFGQVPLEVSVEWASDNNLLKLHDLREGSKYTGGACDIKANPNDPDCLVNRTPVVCQMCHYTPALDLAHVGPRGPENDTAPGDPSNGRDQVKNQSMSRVMHNFHGKLGEDPSKPISGTNKPLFPLMPAPGTNQQARLMVMEENCFQCHPGKRTQCLRGAMFNGGMLCQDCHGEMLQVGNDFSKRVSPGNPGDFIVKADYYDPNSNTPRVPWANVPACQSCHTGDAMDNLAGTKDVIVNDTDTDGHPDGIRLLQAYRNNDAKATPILAKNKRFAETPSGTGPGDRSSGSSNPMLYRVSTGHEGVMCEACHGSTHAIWPNANPNANDNLAAKQAQGHTGKIIECSTCHTGDQGITLDGPHGMHPVGITGQKFADGGHEEMAEKNKDDCRACHGRNGQGTVLAKVAVDRSFTIEECEKGTLCPGREIKPFTVNLKKGDLVTCELCHENKL